MFLDFRKRSPSKIKNMLFEEELEEEIEEDIEEDIEE